jgi:hypothetical protein
LKQYISIMSTIAWPPQAAGSPPLSNEEIAQKVQETTARELVWLLSSLQETLVSLKDGLSSCATLLAPQEPGSTLVLSSHRSEALKGFVNRVGARLVKGEIHLRLAPALPIPRGQSSFRISVSNLPTAPAVVLEQLTTARTLINGSLDVIDATRWTGDAHNPAFIAGQLRLLHEHIQDARAALQGDADVAAAWPGASIDTTAFHPTLPRNLSLHLHIADAAIILTARTVEFAASSGMLTPHQPPTGSRPTTASSMNPPSSNQNLFGGFSLRDRLATALGAAPRPLHDEAGEVFIFHGEAVRVRDKVRVETQDPSLMAALAKLSALERSVALSRKALGIVMGGNGDDEE